MEELKKIAGVTAAKYIEDGMVVGLGTGSTACFFVRKLAVVRKKVLVLLV